MNCDDDGPAGDFLWIHSGWDETEDVETREDRDDGPESERQRRLARGCISGSGGGDDDCRRFERVNHSATRLTTRSPLSGQAARGRDTRTSTRRSP